MAKRGRKPLSSAQLKLRGTFRTDRRRNELRVEPSVPSPPSFLTAEARSEWQRVATSLAGLGVLTQLDRAVMSLYCSAWSDYVTCWKLVNETGYVSVTDKGNTILNPAYRAMGEAWTRCLKAASELGLTPSSRTNIPSQPSKEPDPFEQFLAGG